jgi:hypothetical protein
MNLDTLLAKFGLQKKRTAAQDGVVASYMRTAIETIYSGFQVSDDRLRVWADIERMVGGDEFAAEAVDCLVGDILRVTSLYDQIVTVECEDENLKGVCEEIIKRSGIQSQARQIAYPLVKLHNSYAEFVIDGQARFNRIVPIQSPKTIYRNTDVHGQLLGGSPDERTVGKCAYDQRDITNRFLAGFYPWQIVHWRVPPYDDYGYGIPFLKAARANWLKLCMTEDTLPLARLLRAYMKLVHEVPVPDNATPEMIDQIMEEYKKRLLTKQFNLVADSVLSRQNTPSPYRVDTDFFLPKNADRRPGPARAFP